MISSEKLNKMLEGVLHSKINILKEMQTGLRCKTFLIEMKKQKYIFQVYAEGTKYQAKKKYDILKLFNDEKIQKAISWGSLNEYTYLIIEYKEGEGLTKFLSKKDFSLNDILDSLAKILTEIHSISGNAYGWITDTGVINCDSFYGYITSEFNRLLGGIDTVEDNIKMNIVHKVREALNVVENSKVSKPNLCWYDLNPENILINGMDISAIIDPGGARYGIAEWDLAFVKMEICRNEDEFENFLKSYVNYSKRVINTPLINALSTIIEFDDINIRVNDRIKLPVSYATVFKDEIERIEKNLN